MARGALCGRLHWCNEHDAIPEEIQRRPRRALIASPGASTVNIAILGSGVIGTSAAYYLAKAGHQITVIDRQPGAGLETSFANAGEVSPGYSAPWAGPGVPAKAIKWMLMHHSPLVIRPMLDLAMWRWGVSTLRNCTQSRYRINKGRMVRLAEYSRDCLRELRADTGISYDARTKGTLQLFRTQKQFDGTGKDIEILRQSGVPFQALDREDCTRYEPALADVKAKFVGGLRLPGDETGDCFKFTQELATMARALGAVFKHCVNIRGMSHENGRISSVRTDIGDITADAYLVALGSYSSLLLKSLRISIPVYPVKGYSITVPITDSRFAPESTIMDETYKVAVTRLGDRIRVGGTAELAGYDLRLRDARRRTLNHVITDLFPRSGDVSKGDFWAGLRPMTPDGTPVLGPTPYSNLWLSTGHGTLGWTMAAGSGRLIADWIGGRNPEIDTEGLTMARYNRSNRMTHPH